MRCLSQRLFIPPPLVRLENYSYKPQHGSDTYSEYNYLRPGIAAKLRALHFEHALSLTRPYFHKGNVIDFACGDGPFLPSLSQYFDHVTAIDRAPAFTAVASRVVEAAGLRNVSVLCNEGQTIQETRSKMNGRDYQALFLLEALEHIGNRDDPWASRVGFLKELSTLISPGGLIVVSVPNMIGLPFFLQRVGMVILRQDREPLSAKDFLRASLLGDTAGLERQWSGGHLGFNQRKLEHHMVRDFAVQRRRDVFWQTIYVLRPR
jgi:2-polyprenyl-3-methyl-5-hydroxy-6-metoxy-1,4-benzoquinol methylase